MAAHPDRPVGSVSPLLTRSRANPVLTPDDWPYPVNAVFNPAATDVGGETVLVCRVEDYRGISHLTVARSGDGETGWRVDPAPLIGPDEHGESSRWGVEDPRVTRVDELDAWVVAYTAYGPPGPAVALATTRDFRRIEPLGVVLPPQDKNAALLPRRINGEFVLLHRPKARDTGRSDVWLSRSPDLRQWSAPEPVLAGRPGPWWDQVRIGIGPPPVETAAGWVGFYHGIKHMAGGLVYRAGVVVLEAERPQRVAHRGDDWVLAPREPYERVGDAPNVVFPTGLVVDASTDRLRLYYGAADTCVALASASLAETVSYAAACPRPPSGEP